MHYHLIKKINNNKVKETINKKLNNNKENFFFVRIRKIVRKKFEVVHFKKNNNNYN
jgi:hypothetical protein